MKCPPGCTSCNSWSDCTGCVSYLQLYNVSGTQYCDCPGGLYSTYSPSTYTLTCSPCSLTCGTCSMISSNCTTCKSGKFLYQGNCITDCTTVVNVPMYGNTTDNVCYDCGGNCTACVNSTYCTTCVDNSSLTTYNHDGYCVAFCPGGSIQDNVLH